jgi:hypothetical protein
MASVPGRVYGVLYSGDEVVDLATLSERLFDRLGLGPVRGSGCEDRFLCQTPPPRPVPARDQYLNPIGPAPSSKAPVFRAMAACRGIGRRHRLVRGQAPGQGLPRRFHLHHAPGQRLALSPPADPPPARSGADAPRSSDTSYSDRLRGLEAVHRSERRGRWRQS